jgi:methanogenic corrinoid protein MtbC1
LPNQQQHNAGMLDPGRHMDLDHQQLDSHCQHQFLAELLRNLAPDLSAAAARRFCQLDPTVKDRYADVPCHAWHELFSTWVTDLAASLAVCRPEILHRQVAWTKSLLGARTVSEQDLTAALTALRDAAIEHAPPEDAPLIRAYIASTIEHIAQCPGCPPCHLTNDCPNQRLALEYVVTMLEGDRRAASDLIIGAAKGGVPVRALYLEVLYPAMKELGRMWERNEIDVAEEHFCTATTEMVMSQLYPFLPRTAHNGKVAVVAAAQGNLHQIGVRMVADFLEMDGWRPIYLGANVPAHDLALAVSDFKADVLAIAACLHAHIQSVADAIAVVRSCPQAAPVKIIVGGNGFAGTGSLWQEIGADAMALCVDDAVAHANQLTQPDQLTQR